MSGILAHAGLLFGAGEGSGGDPGGGTYQEMTIAEGPECYLPLNESSGTTANDLSGNGRDGTYGGSVTLGSTALVSGEADTSVLFNAASGNYVQIPSATWMDRDTYAIEFLFRASSISATRTILSRYVNTTNRQFLYRMSNVLGALTYTGGTTIFGSSFGTTGHTHAINETHHVVINVNSTTGDGECWLDGVLIDTESGGTTGSLSPITADLYLGCRNGSSEFWGGNMGHFAFFSHWLEDAYIESKAAKAGLFTP